MTLKFLALAPPTQVNIFGQSGEYYYIPTVAKATVCNDFCQRYSIFSLFFHCTYVHTVYNICATVFVDYSNAKFLYIYVCTVSTLSTYI